MGKLVEKIQSGHNISKYHSAAFKLRNLVVRDRVTRLLEQNRRLRHEIERS